MKILLIDDDPSIRRAVELLLTRAGHEALSAATGAQGAALAAASAPDAILLDWRLEDESGADVCRRLKSDARTRKVAVFALSADDDPRTRAQMLDCGAAAILKKPFSPASLAGQIEREYSRLRRERGADPPRTRGEPE